VISSGKNFKADPKTVSLILTIADFETESRKYGRKC
jgi:hypothetical protein